MAEIKEENVVAKLQCIGYKSYIDEICETTTTSYGSGYGSYPSYGANYAYGDDDYYYD